MSPIYEYQCEHGHVSEEFRKYAARSRPATCHECGLRARPIMSAPRISPDGVYSYAPNVGDPVAFEKRLHAMKEGVAIYPKEAPQQEK